VGADHRRKIVTIVLQYFGAMFNLMFRACVYALRSLPDLNATGTGSKSPHYKIFTVVLAEVFDDPAYAVEGVAKSIAR
jgi:hypothetical protein